MNKMLFGYNFGKLSVAIIPANQAKADREDWVEIDPLTLPPETYKAYAEYKDLYRQAKAAREEFETIMRNEADISTPKAAAKVSGKAQSLSDYLASMRQTGR